MASISRRDAALVGLVLAVWTSVLTLYVGPTYLQPLPIWAKVVIAIALCLLIATVAVYSRRRARRQRPQAGA
jgi:peptidoglycan/LPS O-acetylase OafA/YrhL